MCCLLGLALLVSHVAKDDFWMAYILSAACCLSSLGRACISIIQVQAPTAPAATNQALVFASARIAASGMAALCQSHIESLLKRQVEDIKAKAKHWDSAGRTVAEDEGVTQLSCWLPEACNTSSSKMQVRTAHGIPSCLLQVCSVVGAPIARHLGALHCTLQGHLHKQVLPFPCKCWSLEWCLARHAVCEKRCKGGWSEVFSCNGICAILCLVIHNLTRMACIYTSRPL